jgi:hypothetical protein
VNVSRTIDSSPMLSSKRAMLWYLAIASLTLACPGVADSGASGTGWKPVTSRDRAITAAEVGDADADAAILFREGDLNDTYSDGTSLKIYIRIKVFNERGKRRADVQLPYRLEQGRITDVHARTIRPDGSEVEVDGRDIYDNLLLKTSHGVWRAKVFSMPAVEPGAIIEYRYRQVYPNGFRYFALDLQSDLYTKELYYRIQPQHASKFDLRWVTFNARDPRRFAPQWDGSYYIRATDIPPYRKEPMMPPERTVKIWGWLYYADDFEVEPEKYWRDYAARAFAKTEAETKPTKVIRKIVETITLPQEKLQAKINRIYDYVQSEIKNIGYREEDGDQFDSDSGYKPNDSSDDTIRRGYGTPTEINRLFVAMLRAIGLDARVAELTTRDEAAFHRNFADSLQFTSEVTAVISRDSTVEFYDPGTLYCPCGMLSWEKEAVTSLIHGRKGDPFVETPLTEAKRNERRRVLRVELSEDGRLTAQAELKMFGQQALETRSEVADLSPAERRRHLANEERRSIPSVRIDDASVTAIEDRKDSSVFSLRYGIANTQAVSRTEKRLLLRPALLCHADESLASLPSRVTSLYFHYPWYESDRIEVKVPRGFSLEQLPEPLELDIGAANYRCSFSRSGELVIMERSLMVNAIYLSAEQYPAAKAFFDRVHQSDRRVLSFLQD